MKRSKRLKLLKKLLDTLSEDGYLPEPDKYEETSKEIELELATLKAEGREIEYKIFRKIAELLERKRK